jgi:cell division GTPase FtsZ
MRAHVIGLGGAGGRIVDRLATDRDHERFLHGVSAFDTDRAALASLSAVGEARRHRFGDTAGGEGLTGDLHAGREIGDVHANELCRAMDDQRPSLAEVFVLIVGLGGGAGGGAAPALAAELRRLYDTPVYAIGLLPAAPDRQDTIARSTQDPTQRTGETDPSAVTAEPTRPLSEKNAARTLSALSDQTAAVFPFDTDAWLRRGETLAEARERVNGVVADHVAALFGAGETDSDAVTPQQVLDASDVARAVGEAGEIAALGYATQAVDTPESTSSRFGLGLFGSAKPPSVDTSAAISVIETVIRKATRGKNTIAVADGRADRTLLIVGGPPAWLNREAIAEGRRWLVDETGSGAILSGDAPVLGSEDVFALVVRSGIDEPDRIQEIRDTIP